MVHPVTIQDIQKKLYKQQLIFLNPHQIKLAEPINTFGEHKVTVNFQNEDMPLKLKVMKLGVSAKKEFDDDDEPQVQTGPVATAQ